MTITQERKSTETLVRAAVNAVNDGEFDLRDAARSMVNTIAAERGLSRPWDTPDLELPPLPSVADIGDVHQFSLCFECAEASLSFGVAPVEYPCATVQDIVAALEAS